MHRPMHERHAGSLFCQTLPPVQADDETIAAEYPSQACLDSRPDRFRQRRIPYNREAVLPIHSEPLRSPQAHTMDEHRCMDNTFLRRMHPEQRTIRTVLPMTQYRHGSHHALRPTGDADDCPYNPCELSCCATSAIGRRNDRTAPPEVQTAPCLTDSPSTRNTRRRLRRCPAPCCLERSCQDSRPMCVRSVPSCRECVRREK